MAYSMDLFRHRAIAAYGFSYGFFSRLLFFVWSAIAHSIVRPMVLYTNRATAAYGISYGSFSRL